MSRLLVWFFLSGNAYHLFPLSGSRCKERVIKFDGELQGAHWICPVLKRQTRHPARQYFINDETSRWRWLNWKSILAVSLRRRLLHENSSPQVRCFRSELEGIGKRESGSFPERVRLAGEMPANLTTSNNTEQPVDAGHNFPALIFGVMLIVVIICGNVLVCLSVYTEKALKTTTNYFIVSLAVADLMLAVLVLPLFVYSEVSKVKPNSVWLN